MAHPLECILENAVGELQKLVSADTIIGKPVSAGERTTILPVSRISLGFVSGGGEYGTKSQIVKSGFMLDGSRPYPFTGAVTAGVSAVPVAFLAITDGQVRLLPATQEGMADRMLMSLPDVMREVLGLVQGLKKDKS